MTHPTHRPVRIRAKLQSSVRLGTVPVHLDALIWHALFLKHGDPETAAHELPTVLAQHEGIYQASCMGFGIYPNAENLIATQTATLGVMRQDSDLLAEFIHPTRKDGGYRKLMVEGGPYKNRLTKYKTHYAPEVVWDARGAPDAICDLLNFYVLAVGLEANRGFGAVNHFTWEPKTSDESWADANGNLTRVLPTRIAHTLLQEPADATRHLISATQPPYRNLNTEPCIAPVRVRRIPLTSRAPH